MLLIGVKNINTQDVLTDGSINIGSVYRKYCRKTFNGLPNFTTTDTSLTLNGQGLYHVTATFVGSGAAAGDVTVQMLVNGEAIPGALSTQTITTPDTEIRTFVIDYYLLVDRVCLLGTAATTSNVISFENTGVDATFTDVVVNVSKEV